MNVNLQLSGVFSNLHSLRNLNKEMGLSFTGIIPARYESTRFPGKPLALIDGVPMVVRVWERAKKALNNVYIATDHQDIYEVATKAGAEVILTSSRHETGTERIAEAAYKIFKNKKSSNQVIINIQGDEPMITKAAILDLCDAFEDVEVKIATLFHEFKNIDDLNNPNRPKVIMDNSRNAISFSRSPLQNGPTNYQHIGVYAYKLECLYEINKLHPTPMERTERLEQIRWLNNGYSIRCVKNEYQGIGVDSPEDLEALSKLLQEIRINQKKKNQ